MGKKKGGGGGGRRSFQKNNKDSKNAKTSSRYVQDGFSSDSMDDEIDAFHKQRDIIPLDMNDDVGESDDDDELPVFDVKDIDDDEDEDDEDDDAEYDDDDDDDDVAKMIRQKKYLRAKFGRGEDEMHDDDGDEDEEGDKLSFAGKKFSHGAENRNFELQSSDDEAPKEEEELALQIQREKAKSLTMEDYDLVDISEDKYNEKLTLKDESEKGRGTAESPDRDITLTFENLNALSKEEQMNVLYRSAPELVEWLSELNEAHEQLEHKINPFLSKVKKGEILTEGGVRYFELKQLLLLSYCQAITFCLLLKSEGQPVHEHPVIARLEEIKKLLDQIKQLDSKLPVELEDILKGSNGLESAVKLDNGPTKTDSFTKNQEQPLVSAEPLEEAVPHEVGKIQKLESLKDNVQKASKDKHQKDHIGMQSLEMLKVRASLEEKLKQKGLYSAVASKPSSALKRSRPVNGQLETYDDFDDDAVGVKGATRSVNGSSEVSQILNSNLKKPKVVSGDDDLPKRDDIGERRRKHELRVLAGAGVKTEEEEEGEEDEEMGDLGSDEVSDREDDDESGDSENEFYKQVEQQRAAKLVAKAGNYSRNAVIPSLPETVEGKRHISTQMEKNRGLTRNRNKAKKNPRKNYKLKHQKAVKRRQGQVRSIKKPTAPYGGELSGINAAVSRSIRFKS